MSTMSQSTTDSSFSEINYKSPLKNKQFSKMAFCKHSAQKHSAQQTAPGQKTNKQKVITRDLIRDIYLPREKEQTAALVTGNRLSFIEEHAKIITQGEKQAIIEKQQEEKEKIRAAAAARKAKMEEYDLFRKKNEKLNDLEEETRKNMEYAREKADKQRQENEDEIKGINEYILAAKVQAIRDIQVIEKVAIKGHHKQAELELDEMMERERVEGLNKEEEKLQEKKKEAYWSGSLLQKQIHTNQEKRILEREKKNREGEQQKKRFEKMRLEDEEEMKSLKQKQRELLEQLNREKEEIRRLNEYKKQQSKEEDITISAIQNEKAKREEAAEKERLEACRQREIAIAKMRAMQEKASDLQAEKDAIRARRAQEQKEREYRRKEKEDAIRHQQEQEELRKHRAEQLERQEYLRVLQATKDAQKFAEEMENLKDEIEKEVLISKAKRMGNLKHNEDIRKQIREKELQKIQQRRDFFEEGEHKKQEEKMRQYRLAALQKNKIEDLQKYDMSDNYIANIRRKFGLNQR